MPQSKTHPGRAKKLAKRRAQDRSSGPMTYTEMLDRLRETLNRRFYEEQGFPHLEILAERYRGPVTTGRLSDHLELHQFFIGMAVALANALSSRRNFTMEMREDHCAAVAYAIAATLLDLREDFRDTSGWAGRMALDILRRRWGRSKMAYAGIEDTAQFMDDRSLACYFGMDFVMTFLDLTGELAQAGGASVISVSTCKDEVISAFTSYVTADEALGGSQLVDLEAIRLENAVSEEFRRDYPNWTPEPADALNPVLLGYNGLGAEDMNFLVQLLANDRFRHDMRAIYVRPSADETPQGLREEIVMGYALRYGPRSTHAFGEGREPTEAEMDRDAEVINLLAMTTLRWADPDFVAGVDEDPDAAEARGDAPGDPHVYRLKADPMVENAFATWRDGRLVAGAAPKAEAAEAPVEGAEPGETAHA